MRHREILVLLPLAAGLMPACPVPVDDVGDDRPPAVEEPTPDPHAPAPEAWCDGLDDDADGSVDEGCPCTPGDRQPCYGGSVAHAGVGACAMGEQICLSDFEFGTWSWCDGWVPPGEEVCGDGVDDDCRDGDAPCDEILVLDIDIEGDCVTATCPPSHPHPIGCDVAFVGGDPRGCVAHEPGSSAVYFQEGNVCSAGHVSGTLTCASSPGGGLDRDSCVIHKPEPQYALTPDECPDEGDEQDD